MKKDLQNAREDYTQDTLEVKDVHDNPITQFEHWFEAYKKVADRDYNAMILSTVGVNSKPSSRVVLLKGVDKGGFEFYTNYQSHKGQEIAANPNVALTFYWPELERQVRIEGVVEKMTEQESTEYFKSRPIASQIGACVSEQSKVIENRTLLEKEKERLDKLPEKEIKKPKEWGGYRVKPNLFEFWQGRRSRLHDRIEYIPEGGAWIKRRLAP